MIRLLVCCVALCWSAVASAACPAIVSSPTFVVTDAVIPAQTVFVPSAIVPSVAFQTLAVPVVTTPSVVIAGPPVVIVEQKAVRVQKAGPIRRAFGIKAVLK